MRWLLPTVAVAAGRAPTCPAAHTAIHGRLGDGVCDAALSLQGKHIVDLVDIPSTDKSFLLGSHRHLVSGEIYPTNSSLLKVRIARIPSNRKQYRHTSLV